jgi:hypothetical protein
MSANHKDDKVRLWAIYSVWMKNLQEIFQACEDLS